MKILGLMRVRNEARWLDACLRAQWFCDRILVLDDNSTDETSDICARFSKVYHMRKNYDVGYEEGVDRMFLAEWAAQYNPEWICSMDGDEVLFDDTWSKIKYALDKPEVHVIEVENLNLWDSPHTIRVDGSWGGQYRQRFWRFKSGPLTYQVDHCALPDQITERPFTRVGARMFHYGYMDKASRMPRYLRYKAMGHDWPTLIQEDGVRLVPWETVCNATS